jgi:DNA-binding transcriptional MerR regulator
MREDARYSIEELAAKAGISRRTVRYYVQRGLLPAPYGLGRGRHYGEEHLAVLLQAKVYQEKGLDLETIRQRLRPESKEEDLNECDTRRLVLNGPAYRASDGQVRTGFLAPGEVYFHQPVLPGYQLQSGAGSRPLSAGELATLAEFLQDLIERGGRNGER